MSSAQCVQLAFIVCVPAPYVDLGLITKYRFVVHAETLKCSKEMLRYHISGRQKGMVTGERFKSISTKSGQRTNLF